MHPGKNLAPEPILSRDGLTLLLHTPDNGRPVLLNAAGETISPWEVELLHCRRRLRRNCAVAAICPVDPLKANPGATVPTKRSVRHTGLFCLFSCSY